MNNLLVLRKTLNNTLTEFNFGEYGSKFLVKNFTDSDIYASFESDGTKSVTIPSKKAFILASNEFNPDGHKSVYVLGTGEVEVRVLLRYFRPGGKETILSGPRYFVDLENNGGSGETTVVELINLTGTLTDAQYTELLGNNAVIAIGTQYYYKAYDASTLLVYQALTRQGAQNSVLYDYVEITKSTKAYEVKYNQVVKANETLAGTETELTELTVGATKYAVPQGTTTIDDELSSTSENPSKTK